MGASKILGIVGLCSGWLFPIAGLTLGIIGLSIKKEKGKEDRDRILNILSIVLSIFAWIIWISIFGGI